MSVELQAQSLFSRTRHSISPCLTRGSPEKPFKELLLLAVAMLVWCEACPSQYQVSLTEHNTRMHKHANLCSAFTKRTEPRYRHSGFMRTF